MNHITIDTLKRIIFIDIETVKAYRSFKDLPEVWRKLWRTKAKASTRMKDLRLAESYNRFAAIYSEFAKVVCISVGMFKGNDWEDIALLTKTFSGSETDLLIDFNKWLEPYSQIEKLAFCGHNIREFDIPFLSRRMLVNGLRIPNLIDLQGKPPWEIRHIDTLRLWKFGDYKSFTSLELLTTLFGIQGVKTDVSGDQVDQLFWDGDLERIIKYCESDVAATALLFLKMHGQMGDVSEVESIRKFPTETEGAF